MTDKYTRTFADFSNYPWPGKILPQYFEHGDYEDGYRGTQGMLQHIVSAYGAYHIVEGASPTIDGTEWTGTAAYGMFSGAVKELAAASGDLDDEGEFLIYNSAGTFAVTGDKPTGIILARNVKGTVYTAYRREDDNSKNYFPNNTYHYGAVNSYTGVLGHGDIISGYESVSADSGIFQHIEGFSDIEMGDSLDFGGSYHLKGVSQITGAIISGTQITGTSGLVGDMQLTTTNLLPIGTVLMYNATGLGGDLETRTEQIGDHVSDSISMPGWYVCNGESGTPNLMNKFVMCSGAVGKTGGEDEVTLTTDEIPAHTHESAGSHDHSSPRTSSTQSASHTHGISNNIVAETPQTYAIGVGAVSVKKTTSTTSTQSASHTHSVTIPSDGSHTHTSVGGGSAHENRPSFYSLVFITRVS